MAREYDRLILTRIEQKGQRERNQGAQAGSAGQGRAQAVSLCYGRQDAGVTYEYEVKLADEDGASVAVPEIGRRISLKVIDWPARGSDTRRLQEALDRALLRPPMVLRNWRPGDAYRPRGRHGVKKLKRLFADRRIVTHLRETWPVLTSAGRVVWASGFPVAEEFAAGAGTRTAVAVAEEEL